MMPALKALADHSEDRDHVYTGTSEDFLLLSSATSAGPFRYFHFHWVWKTLPF